MEKDIAEGKLGTIGGYDLEFKGGKLIAKVNVGAEGISGALSLEFDADKLLDALAKAIPSQIDDALIGVLKGALKL